MVERKKTVKKTKAGKAGKTTVKQQVKQTVKVVVGDIGKKKAVRRRPAKKPAPGLTRPATGAYSGGGISDRVVIPPSSRADPSLYNKDALLTLTNQIKQLEYKADNAQLNLSGLLANQLQNRLTFNSNASNEAYPQGVKVEQAGPDLIEADPITDKRMQRAIRKANREAKREPSFTGFSNMFQQEQINKGNASAKAQEKKEELKDEKFAPIRFLEEPMTATETERDEMQNEDEVIVAKPKAKPIKKVSADQALKKMKAIAKRTN
jgi:hypothetical protein